MANLRDLRNRINSIKNTQQITKAMKMVAAAKLRKAQQRMTATRPYADKMSNVVARLTLLDSAENPLLRQPEELKKVLLVVVGSDKGLCGGFNNNLFRIVETHISEKLGSFRENGTLSLITIGKKAGAYFTKRDYNVIEKHPGFFDDLTYESTSEIMNSVTQKFSVGEYDSIQIAFNEFKTVISQNRLVVNVLPFEMESEDDSDDGSPQEFINYIYEPDADTILEKLLPVHLNMQLWRAVLESNASEQGARMAAMDNATENAKELEEDLSLKYNQLRQSAITTEISEIVSGAAALERN